MPVYLFYIFAGIMLGFALAVVLLKNPVSSALALVMSFVGLAALYISLNAYFVGTLQILVYAGAVMVLFLFIIMLLDIKADEKRKLNKVAFIGGAVLVFCLAAQIASLLGDFRFGKTRLDAVAIDYKAATAARGAAKLNVATIERDLAAETLPDAKLIGEALFSRYHLHLQIIGVLLLVATVGVVVLSRREDKPASTP
jgi:NADH-quinone oxidoreductase subunit J